MAQAAIDTGGVDVLITADPTEGSYRPSVDDSGLILQNSSDPYATRADFEKIASSVKIWIDTQNGASFVDNYGNWGAGPDGVAGNVIFRDYPDITHGDTGSNINNLIDSDLMPPLTGGTAPITWQYTSYMLGPDHKTWIVAPNSGW